jgi:hypothetical protein
VKNFCEVILKAWETSKVYEKNPKTEVSKLRMV